MKWTGTDIHGDRCCRGTPEAAIDSDTVLGRYVSLAGRKRDFEKPMRDRADMDDTSLAQAVSFSLVSRIFALHIFAFSSHYPSDS